jgi:hypothetical protein
MMVDQNGELIPVNPVTIDTIPNEWIASVVSALTKVSVQPQRRGNDRDECELRRWFGLAELVWL